MSDAAAIPMDENELVSGNENAAWAAINAHLSPEELLAFCKEDVERLFRINPYLEVESWKRIDENRYAFSGRNSSQEQPFDFDLELEVEELSDGLRIRYTGGLKTDTLFRIESSSHGSKLTIHESYPPLEEGDERLATVDRSLTTWAGDIQKFLIAWKQWGWLWPWRWYMNRVWKPMKPSGRRIAYMFWWITLVEIALIMLGVGIYFAEYA